MTDPKLKVTALIDKYLAGECTSEECRTVENAYNETALKKHFEDRSVNFDRIGQESLQYIYATINTKQATKQKHWPRLAVAASLLLIAAAGLWFYISSSSVSSRQPETVYQNDIGPGKNTATLTLANGKTILLSDARTGIVIEASKLSYNDGSIITASTGQQGQSAVISTPKGGQYQVQLPDGTRVWLNATSTLSFSSMTSRAPYRRVELHGEAYFEVAKDKRHPFVVKTGGQEVKVLGTHFNINGYADDRSIKTALLEGSVQVSANGVGHMIKPGQQAVWVAGEQLKVQPANIKEVVAWKNGYFQFRDQRIDQIMLQLSRWYNIEVKYEGKMPEEKFNGNISRYKKISEVLDMLSYARAVRFKVEGRRVTVMQ